MKTNFLNKLKQGLFLLIAVLGTFTSYSQATTTTTIGGSKTPDTGGFNDIGGKGGTEAILITILPLTTQCTFAYFDETGGRNGTGTSSDTGQVDNPDDFDDTDTGGRGTSTNTGENPLADIGGRGTSTDTGQITTADYLDFFDIGGRSTGGEFSALDTGGKNSTGGMENTCPICPDTGGGNGGKNTTGELMITDTGGRDTGGGYINQGSASDIGGRSDTGTGSSPIAFCGDFNSDVAYIDGSEAENEPIPGCVFDTGGRGGVGTSTGGDVYIGEEMQSFDLTENTGCILRPFFQTD